MSGSELALRLRHMVFGWGSIGLGYGLAMLSTSLDGRPARVLEESALDALLPFDPAGIWAYLSFFVLIPATWLLAPRERLGWLERAMQACAILSCLVFIVWPTTLRYPPIPQQGWTACVLRTLGGADTERNCLPSLHGALTLLCCWAWCDWRNWPKRSALFVLWGVAIAIGVVLTRRHLTLDLGAGAAMGLLLGVACRLADPWGTAPARSGVSSAAPTTVELT